MLTRETTVSSFTGGLSTVLESPLSARAPTVAGSSSASQLTRRTRTQLPSLTGTVPTPSAPSQLHRIARLTTTMALTS